MIEKTIYKPNLLPAYSYNPTFENWLLIDTEGNAVEFQTKEDAKTAARLKYE